MFGFGDEKNNNGNAKSHRKLEREYIQNAMLKTFGVCEPTKINQIWREYIPEVTNAILNAEDAAVKSCISLVNVNENINIKHDEVLEELKSLRLQNKELQEKYNALVERMAGYIERENGKGR